MKKKIAVIGFGGMGSWHVNHALKSDVLELSGIWDIDNKKRNLAKERDIYAYGSLEELLNDKSVELVTIAIPNDVHLEMVLACLNAGKNVIRFVPSLIVTDEEIDKAMSILEKCLDKVNK